LLRLLRAALALPQGHTWDGIWRITFLGLIRALASFSVLRSAPFWGKHRFSLPMALRFARLFAWLSLGLLQEGLVPCLRKLRGLSGARPRRQFRFSLACVPARSPQLSGGRPRAKGGPHSSEKKYERSNSGERGGCPSPPPPIWWVSSGKSAKSPGKQRLSQSHEPMGIVGPRPTPSPWNVTARRSRCVASHLFSMANDNRPPSHKLMTRNYERADRSGKLQEKVKFL
jgi:hypothetical protein